MPRKKGAYPTTALAATVKQSLSEREVKRLKLASKLLNKSQAQIVREALGEWLDKNMPDAKAAIEAARQDVVRRYEREMSELEDFE